MQLQGEEADRVAVAIAKQIEVEQGLSTSRVNWNLTFQGFMIAGYAVLAAAPASQPAKHILHNVICGVGIAVAVITLIGLAAAGHQIDYLKQHWSNVIGHSSSYPRPFSDALGSKLGRYPSRVLCWVLIGMWGVLLYLGSGQLLQTGQ